MRQRWTTHVWAWMAALAIAAPACGQSARGVKALNDAIFEHFDRREHARCVELIKQYLDLRPGDTQMLYNLACAHALLREENAAVNALLRAERAGFRDFTHMKNDPDLEAIRDHPTYLKILKRNRPGSGGDADSVISLWRNRFGEDGYKFGIEEEYRLAYATALSDEAERDMRKMIEREADHLIETLFDAPPDAFALVAVPKREHANELLKGDPSIGGIYDHNQRVLVTRDIGSSLRHEFFHLMHHGHMDRLGQRHPLWIQEGLASLYEDYELREDGSITFHANERHNVVLNRLREGRLFTWSELFNLSETRFMRVAGQAYPQVRSMFEFVAEKGKLTAWYKALIENFGTDRSGRVAFESVFGKPLKDIERSWKAWVRARPAVDMTIVQGDASLGVEGTLHTASDGVEVSRILPGGAASRSNLKLGDVIVSVNGQPTRSLLELQRKIGAMKIGQTAELRVRRGQRHVTVRVRLTAFRHDGR